MKQRPGSKRWAIAVGLMLAALTCVAFACAGDEDDAAQLPGANGHTASEGDAPEAAIPPSGESAATDGGDASATGSSAPGSVLPALLDRQIIRTATVTIETDEVSKRFEEVGNIAAGAGGFVASSAFGNTGHAQTASVTVRVPGEQYQEALRQLRALGDVQAEQSSASDVTEEFTDLESRLRNLQATERQYLEFFSRAGDINQTLVVQDRLNVVRGEIEQVQGRINLLGNQTALATITVHLEPPVLQLTQGGGGSRSIIEVAEDAWEASLAVLFGIAIVGVAVVAFSWWLFPLAALGWYFGRKQLRADRERRAE